MAFKEFTGELDVGPAPIGKFREFTGTLDPQPMTDREAWESSLPVRVLRGVEAPAITLMKMVGPESIKQQLADIDALRESGMKKRGNEGFDWAGLAGGLIPGGAIASGITKALPAATTLLGKMGVGAAAGAAAAGAQPLPGDELSTEKLKQMGGGAVVGGTIPAVVAGAKGIGGLIHTAVEPLTERGRANILQRFQEKLIGETPNAKQKVVQALLQAREIVPGSQPTVAEAVAVLPEGTGLAAHQKLISRLEGISPTFLQRGAEQESARAGAVRAIGKTAADLEAAVKLREATAGQKYQNAFNVILNRKVPKSIMGNPYVKEAVPDAMKLAQANQIDPKTNLTQFLHYVKIGLDKQLGRTGDTALHETEKKAAQDVKKQLLGWLKKQNPLYDEARETFKVLSDPINRMQVGQQMEEALISPLGTAERSATFAQAMRNTPATIKKATGQRVYDDLADVLTAQEMQSVRNVLSDLTRKDAAARLARGTGLSGHEAIPGNVGLPIPNLLSRPAMLTNFLMRHAGQSAEGKIAQRAALQYLNPARLAQELQPVPPRYAALLDAMTRQAVGAAGTTVGRTQ